MTLKAMRIAKAVAPPKRHLSTQAKKLMPAKKAMKVLKAMKSMKAAKADTPATRRSRPSRRQSCKTCAFLPTISTTRAKSLFDKKSPLLHSIYVLHGVVQKPHHIRSSLAIACAARRSSTTRRNSTTSADGQLTGSSVLARIKTQTQR